ncbi:ATP phosphoribosyltransferase regulatory subunit [Altererythrobacter sp. H2]|uniref:ATP phosphoribosyltransferase regulatory subunit n=1 Tax=Altererythrobacter sp. H2 TaxID=3108391 RepID=UPI002B4BAA08|nr:ATP phosphoribosyltransferase regulatory subunit [Altererythrobacter sp. H2]WRK96542.1 ATP phosphoribosyltransferase regulatory subunit [Altererythrobacter sp. H2]
MTDPDDLLPEGLADRLPAEAALVTAAMRAALDVLDSNGYDRVRPPLVEFERSMATRMDGVSPRRMFRFVDPASLRTLALRSDMTVQVGRIAATSLAGAARPLRLCYAGEVATIRADQLDPARQKLQLGAELIGSDSPEAAGEVVALAIKALAAAGASGISVDFTLPDLVDTLAEQALPLASQQVDAVRRELDMKDAGALREVGGAAYLPLLYAAGPFDDAIERIAAIDAGGALASRIAGLRQIAARAGVDARVTLDPTERHGFEYQSWFGFTLYAEGVRGALGRGGTYVIRSSEEPATGFSLYLDSLIEALESPQRRPTIYLPLGHEFDAAEQLRSEGWRTVAGLAKGEDPAGLGCTHVLIGTQVQPLDHE